MGIKKPDGDDDFAAACIEQILALRHAEMCQPRRPSFEMTTERLGMQ